MGRSEKADQELIDVIDELIWDLEDIVDREREDFLNKFFKWFHGNGGDWNGAEARARKKLIARRQRERRERERREKERREKERREQQRIKELNAWKPAHPDMVWAVNKNDEIFYRHGKNGTWTKVPGGLKQVSTGPVGTFGVSENDEIYYRYGTHEDNNSAGHEWQRLPGKLKWVSAGKNAVWGVSASDQIFCLSPIVLNGDKLDFSKMDWQHVPGGLMQISAAKNSDVVWGVASNGTIWYRLNRNANWEHIPGGLMQVAVGNAGVYGVNSSHEIFYRDGTNAKPDSKGTGWTLLPGALKNITVGRNGLWGANKKYMIYWAACNSTNCKSPPFELIPGGLKQISAY